jgi:hypothetical protein
MENEERKEGIDKNEVLTLTIGFYLAGIIIWVTGISYALNSPFSHRWLMWIIAVAFCAVATLALEWPRAFNHQGEVPKGGQRQFLLLSIPLAYVLCSQICGLGVKACTVPCSIVSISLITLAILIAIRISHDKSVLALLIPVIVLSVIPHCVCKAPINVVWHNLSQFSPTCEVIPLLTVLFSITALRGARTRSSTVLVVIMIGMTVFIAAGNVLLGFPWKGCVSQF